MSYGVRKGVWDNVALGARPSLAFGGLLDGADGSTSGIALQPTRAAFAAKGGDQGLSAAGAVVVLCCLPALRPSPNGRAEPGSPSER
jgi:hypothetical protein